MFRQYREQDVLANDVPLLFRSLDADIIPKSTKKKKKKQPRSVSSLIVNLCLVRKELKTDSKAVVA